MNATTKLKITESTMFWVSFLGKSNSRQSASTRSFLFVASFMRDNLQPHTSFCNCSRNCFFCDINLRYTVAEVLPIHVGLIGIKFALFIINKI